MLKSAFAFLILTVASICVSAQWGPAKSTVIPEADGYVAIPRAAVAPSKSRIYRAVYDGTHAAKQPSQILPVLNMAGSELNVLAGTGVSLKNPRFVIVFHGPAVDGILNNASYKAKFGIDNPNLPVLAKLRKSGVEIFVCGQHLAAENIDPKTLSRDVTIATDALIVLMAYQNDGYALLSF